MREDQRDTATAMVYLGGHARVPAHLVVTR